MADREPRLPRLPMFGCSPKRPKQVVANPAADGARYLSMWSTWLLGLEAQTIPDGVVKCARLHSTFLLVLLANPRRSPLYPPSLPRDPPAARGSPAAHVSGLIQPRQLPLRVPAPFTCGYVGAFPARRIDPSARRRQCQRLPLKLVKRHHPKGRVKARLLQVPGSVATAPAPARDSGSSPAPPLPQMERHRRPGRAKSCTRQSSACSQFVASKHGDRTPPHAPRITRPGRRKGHEAMPCQLYARFPPSSAPLRRAFSTSPTSPCRDVDRIRCSLGRHTSRRVE